MHHTSAGLHNFCTLTPVGRHYLWRSGVAARTVLPVLSSSMLPFPSVVHSCGAELIQYTRHEQQSNCAANDQNKLW